MINFKSSETWPSSTSKNSKAHFFKRSSDSYLSIMRTSPSSIRCSPTKWIKRISLGSSTYSGCKLCSVTILKITWRIISRKSLRSRWIKWGEGEINSCLLHKKRKTSSDTFRDSSSSCSICAMELSKTSGRENSAFLKGSSLSLAGLGNLAPIGETDLEYAS